jgi:dihydroflavonol-4-reductase
MTVHPKDTLVLITGASGYIGGHCVVELLRRGYRVRGTVRGAAKRSTVERLADHIPGSAARLEIVEADLSSDEGWPEAVRGCTYIQHVASPFPSTEPDDERDIVGPAVDGTKRVLAAAASTGGIKRIVLTSSVAAVAYGRPDDSGHLYTESDWSNPDRCNAYQKSKTLAERAAWDFIATVPAERRFELAVINPGFVIGPMLDADVQTSAEVVKRLMRRELPGCPELGFAVVDVRDIAIAHRLAMETPAAAGKRFICAGEHYWVRDLAEVLATEFGPYGYRVPTRKLPYWLLWIAARFDRELKLVLDYIGRKELVSHELASEILGWTPRPLRESLADMGHSMIEHGVVPRTPQYVAPSKPVRSDGRAAAA